MTDEQWMKQAIKQAKKAAEKDEVPIGCIIVHDGKIISRAYNQREIKQLSTAHAEILAIQKACRKLGTWRLENCDLYVTLEPCPMCTGAIIQSRIRRVIFGAYDPKGGCMGSCTDLLKVKGFNHYPEVSSGICQEECSDLLKEFFKEKRKQKKS
ncbi:tRNA adenosine(34) deaminase TadA [Catenisphaera adipataccumulans]|uniref:tRNA-specific adenosine deaminase n=1 Tax=Catenisphaera adipataccumulans TaxID=700500 RepID=A0A7W8CZF6_9FIRM|nr:tRNA adenosine(34) deaminase TadA [Catenisphaera adipataccumulans]MBB5183839.1 tRNA(adenine34) deaminase [Catenisphaera adipataccumulans]